MNKSELVDDVAKQSGLSKTDAKKAVEAFTQSVTDGLRKKSDGNVTLPGFGSFSLTRREAREGRNPSNGQTIKIPAQNAVKFKAGKTLKEKVK